MVNFATQQMKSFSPKLLVLVAAVILCPAATLCQPGFAQSLTPPTDATPEQQLQFWEELAYWEAVKDSDVIADLESYLAAYPAGRFKALAEAKIQALQGRSAADSPPSEEKPQTCGVWYLAGGNSNVRSGAGTRNEKIGIIERNSRVLVVGESENGSWYEVALEDGTTGFVYAQLLQKADAEERVCIALAPQSSSGRDAADQTQPVETTTTDAGGTLATSGDILSDCAGCPELVVISPGSFTMGAAKRRNEEKPPHGVSISYPFALGATEVTIGQWQLCLQAGGCKLEPAAEFAGNPQVPMANLSWDDAQEYIRWLSTKTGRQYRLPSEAEWEYAARAGTNSVYSWGNDAVGAGLANCADCGSQWDGKGPAPVASFQANPFGLYDMHGNLWEWTQDCWNRSYKGAPADGSAWEKGDCLARVQRGGAWRLDAEYMRTTRRGKYDRDVRYYLNGFRVARDIP